MTLVGPHIYHSIHQIKKSAWNALTEPDNPFLDHEFLAALEDGHCLNEKTGWMPRYLTIEDEKGELVSACPLFLKTHSYGEFLFDFQWAQASYQSGIPYYPKLVCAVPVTPVTGNRILIKPGTDRNTIRQALDEGLTRLLERTGSRSIHFLYCRQEESDFLKDMGFLKRHTFEYRWTNPGYQSFDDFLAALTHKVRAQVRKERKAALRPGLKIQTLTGNAITTEHIDHAYNFYTIHHHFVYDAPTYLTRDFFHRVRDAMADRLLLILVRKGGRTIAGAINFYKGKGLYGRYWGYLEALRYLHFEVCYYRLIEFAIKNKMRLFEAGAQGEHKIKRGLVPFYTFSSHRFVHGGFYQAIRKYLEAEKEIVDQKFAYFSKRSPYRKD